MYGLIGKNLGHSFSANFFNNKFEKEKIKEEYRLFPLKSIDEFPHLLEDNQNLKGLNVTIPYKESIIPYLDNLSKEAKEIGAVNVIKIEKEKGRFLLKGHNTDCIGFKNSLLPFLTPEIKGALILGTGGASKAVKFVLKELGLEVLMVSRKHSDNSISYEEFTKEILQENLLIVNTTPLGMFPDIESAPNIPYQYITPEHVCYDLVYNPQETMFMKECKKQGAKVKNGLEMLELQALASWDIWNS